MIDERLDAGMRTAFLAALLVENMRRQFNVSDADMDELVAGSLQVLLLADGGNEAMGELVNESHQRLWGVIAGVDAGRDGKTVN